jgi:hypothetical protein
VGLFRWAQGGGAASCGPPASPITGALPGLLGVTFSSCGTFLPVVSYHRLLPTFQEWSPPPCSTLSVRDCSQDVAFHGHFVNT